MESWNDVTQWSEELKIIHVVKLLKTSGYTVEQVSKEVNLPIERILQILKSE